MRVATIDIGTNTALLLIAETQATADGEALVPVLEEATITRLGQGVDKTRTLAPEAVERTLACLREYSALVKQHGASRVAIVGTSAMRDAAGGEALRAEIEALFGVAPQVISGEREALLTFDGALSGLSLSKGAESTVVFDIGGGSTEVVLGATAGGSGGRNVSFTTSIDVGSVRLTERHVNTDPPSEDELAALEQAVRKSFLAVPDSVRSLEPVGIAGTMTTIAAVSFGLETYDAERVHGAVLPVAEIQRVTSLLARLPLAERKKVPGMEPKRADVIVAGAVIALGLLSRLGATHVRISDRGVRWGLALELAR